MFASWVGAFLPSVDASLAESIGAAVWVGFDHPERVRGRHF